MRNFNGSQWEPFLNKLMSHILRLTDSVEAGESSQVRTLFSPVILMR